MKYRRAAVRQKQPTGGRPPFGDSLDFYNNLRYLSVCSVVMQAAYRNVNCSELTQPLEGAASLQMRSSQSHGAVLHRRISTKPPKKNNSALFAIEKSRVKVACSFILLYVCVCVCVVVDCWTYRRGPHVAHVCSHHHPPPLAVHTFPRACHLSPLMSSCVVFASQRLQQKRRK